MALRRIFRFGALVTCLSTLLMAPASTASAHTDLESTIPADQETVVGPLTEIVLTYTKPTTESENGFVVLKSDGTEVEPIQIDQEGNSYTLVFNPGLDEGTYGVRWEVLAEDGHPLDGSFQFNVSAPPTTTAAPTTPTTTDPDATTPATDPSESAAPTTTLVATVPPTVASSTIPGAGGTTVPPTTSPEFGALINDESGSGTETMSRIGHLLRFAGTIFGVGAVAALIWVIVSDRDDLYTLLNATRLAGIVVALGGVTEWAAFQEVAGGGLGSLFSTRTGGAALFTIFGGLMMLFGLTERNSLEPTGDAFRWKPGPRSAVGLVGAALVVLGFGFDGHLATRGPNLILAVADIVHVGVAALWAGGVAALAMVAFLRRRRGRPSLLAESVVRFSPVATIGLIAVTITGFAMAAMIVQDPGAPTDSPWGRTMIIKLVFVAMAAMAGAYNRFSLVPVIQRNPESAETARRIRFSLTVEASIFVVVVIITAILVTLDLFPL